MNRITVRVRKSVFRILLLCAGLINAYGLEPLFSERGELLFEDLFIGVEVRPERRALHGTRWKIEKGVLKGIPSTKEFHAGCSNHAGTTQTTSGYIFRLILDVEKGVALQRDRHSQIEGDKNEILDRADWTPTRDCWITVLIETRGEEVVAQIVGGPTLRMRAARLAVPKRSGNLKARGGEVID